MSSKNRSYDRKDRLYRRAKEEGFASRAAYKLLELNKKYRLLTPGAAVLDLGCSPGAWTQVALEALGPAGFVVGVDLEMAQLSPSSLFAFIQGDARETAIQESIGEALGQAGRRQVEAVLSDLSPKLSGIAIKDQQESLRLTELAFDLAGRWLAPGGAFVFKAFPSADLEAYRKSLARYFAQCKWLQLEASRATSREGYFLGLGFKPTTDGGGR